MRVVRRASRREESVGGRDVSEAGDMISGGGDNEEWDSEVS